VHGTWTSVFACWAPASDGLPDRADTVSDQNASLFRACRSGDGDQVSKLLADGADVNYKHADFVRTSVIAASS
jgi:ankyrin repeat protein